jgi:hypothetical protein
MKRSLTFVRVNPVMVVLKAGQLGKSRLVVGTEPRAWTLPHIDLPSYFARLDLFQGFWHSELLWISRVLCLITDLDLPA